MSDALSPEEIKRRAARSRTAAYRRANPEKAAAAVAASKAKKPEKYRQIQRDAYVRNIKQRREVSAAWRAANPERNRELVARWVSENKERRREIARDWNRNNREKVNAVYARRRAAKKCAAPRWANQFFISEAYHLARLRTEATGYQWHVDHIVPLQHPLVCGLHVEHNIQVIPGSVNQSKNNRHWPDMP